MIKYFKTHQYCLYQVLYVVSGEKFLLFTKHLQIMKWDCWLLICKDMTGIDICCTEGALYYNIYCKYHSLLVIKETEASVLEQLNAFTSRHNSGSYANLNTWYILNFLPMAHESRDNLF